MSEVARIRMLVGEGKTDAEIVDILRREQQAANGFGWDSPKRMFRALSLTMRRAAQEQRPVGAREVLPQLQLFRRLWEELVASGDVQKVEAVVQKMLREVAGDLSVSQAFILLEHDMSQLSVPATGAHTEEDKARAEVAKRYQLQALGQTVVCAAKVGAVVAEASDLIFEVVSVDPRYAALFPTEVLRTCLDVIAVPRPTWGEMLREAGVVGRRLAA